MRRVTSILLVLSICALVARGEVELHLVDGRVLTGVDVRRADGQYLLEMENGDVVALPEELVAEVQLREIGHDRRMPPRPGMIVAEPQTLAGDEPVLGDPDASTPVGLVPSDPRQLEGPPAQLVTPESSLAVLGEPSKFQKGVFNHDWVPSTDWDMSLENNNFAPSTWSKSIIDSSWSPSSDYRQDTDVTDFNPSSFQEGVIDNSWQPEDGFRKQSMSTSG
jgi:hypothetical protein